MIPKPRDTPSVICFGLDRMYVCPEDSFRVRPGRLGLGGALLGRSELGLRVRPAPVVSSMRDGSSVVDYADQLSNRVIGVIGRHEPSSIGLPSHAGGLGGSLSGTSNEAGISSVRSTTGVRRVSTI